jgi:hypothetical protein
MFEIFLFWLIASVLVGIGAAGRGRNGFGWFLLAVIISPLLAFILLALLPNLRLLAMMEAPYRAQQVDDVALRNAIARNDSEQPTTRQVVVALVVLIGVVVGVAYYYSSGATGPPASAPMIAPADTAPSLQPMPVPRPKNI